MEKGTLFDDDSSGGRSGASQAPPSLICVCRIKCFADDSKLQNLSREEMTEQNQSHLQWEDRKLEFLHFRKVDVFRHPEYISPGIPPWYPAVSEI